VKAKLQKNWLFLNEKCVFFDKNHCVPPRIGFLERPRRVFLALSAGDFKVLGVRTIVYLEEFLPTPPPYLGFLKWSMRKTLGETPIFKGF
jgi:hypothetical protein